MQTSIQFTVSRHHASYGYFFFLSFVSNEKQGWKRKEFQMNGIFN